jgi:SSS family solute:Na+ symporter
VVAALTVAYDLLAGALPVPVIGAILWKGGTSLAALISITVVGSLFVKGMDSDAPI